MPRIPRREATGSTGEWDVRRACFELIMQNLELPLNVLKMLILTQCGRRSVGGAGRRALCLGFSIPRSWG